VLHVLEYAVFGLLFYTYAGGCGLGFFTVVAIGCAYGVSDEVHQLFTPGRFFSIHDMACDATGSLIGAYASMRLTQG
jgi:VanZ family protein